jgi:hypothetical protein
MNRLQQDAADALAAQERQRKWRERVRADLARSQDSKIVGSWKPMLTEQQKQEQDRYIAENNLPF